jgi:transposase
MFDGSIYLSTPKRQLLYNINSLKKKVNCCVPSYFNRSRSQAIFFPKVLDDFIRENNPVSVIDIFVDELPLNELGFKGVVPKDTGRPNYFPAMLLKLYLYGYLNHIQSANRLEREANRNIELMWLTERLVPDFKTITDFRKNNARGIKQSCQTFVGLS